jgi:dTDP-4-amino-4,6-dideoxygalactose transaminase
MDPSDLATKISSRTRAIVVVHLAGYLADMNAIMDLADRHDLSVIEDAAHAVGAVYLEPGPHQGRAAGTIGTLGCFSFFANKNLVTGEGGMVTTDHGDLALRVRLGRSHGMTKTSWDKAAGRAVDYDIVEIGYNYRPTELTAAMGSIQLRKLPAAQERRRDLTERYRELLSARPGITIPFADHTAGSSYHIVPIVLPSAEMRPAFRASLDLEGIQTSVHYPPVHRFTHYAESAPDTELPHTDDVAEREVTVPLHPLLEVAHIDEIAAAIIAAYDTAV